MTKQAIVTGGSGFLGSVLIDRLLDAGYEVHNLDLQPSGRVGVIAHQVDIADQAQLATLELPASAHVVHLAGRQYSTPVKRRARQDFFHQGNVVGTQNVLRLATRIGAQSFSFVSTDMVYGTPQSTPIGIDHPRRPFGPYGQSKVKAEDLITADALAFRTLIFRPRLIIGPGRFGLMAKLFAAIRNNLPVPMIGNGRNVYQMVSVFDCAGAILQGIERPKAEGIFNLGSEPRESSKELIRKLIATAGSRSIVLSVPSWAIKPVLRSLDWFDASPLVPEQFEIADQHYILDVQRTKAVLGWSPTHGDHEMMAAAYREYCETVA